MHVSWPLAFGGAFQGALTGRDNARLIARVYGVDVKETITRVEDFAELGLYLDEPVKSYSSGMNSRLSFALSMAIDFDCFLVDEVISVGDVRFNRRCEEELKRRKNNAMVLVSHHTDLIRNNCDHAAFLQHGRLHFLMRSMLPARLMSRCDGRGYAVRPAHQRRHAEKYTSAI
jgi:capsular polysaccharide transport system ATP-binding protein